MRIHGTHAGLGSRSLIYQTNACSCLEKCFSPHKVNLWFFCSCSSLCRYSWRFVSLCVYIYLAALSRTARITLEISAFPLELFPSDAMEDALQNVCGLQYVESTVKAGYREEGWHFYSRECINFKGQSLKISDIKLSNSLELFDSEPAIEEKKWLLSVKNNGLNLWLSEWRLISLSKR